MLGFSTSAVNSVNYADGRDERCSESPLRVPSRRPTDESERARRTPRTLAPT